MSVRAFHLESRRVRPYTARFGLPDGVSGGLDSVEGFFHDLAEGEGGRTAVAAAGGGREDPGLRGVCDTVRALGGAFGGQVLDTGCGLPVQGSTAVAISSPAPRST